MSWPAGTGFAAAVLVTARSAAVARVSISWKLTGMRLPNEKLPCTPLGVLVEVRVGDVAPAVLTLSTSPGVAGGTGKPPTMLNVVAALGVIVNISEPSEPSTGNVAAVLVGLMVKLSLPAPPW